MAEIKSGNSKSGNKAETNHKKEAVYLGLHGPHFETPAEIRMATTFGADMVGMSTVLETIAARHLGMNVLALSLATNLASGLSGKKLSGEEVIQVGKDSSKKVGDLLSRILIAFDQRKGETLAAIAIMANVAPLGFQYALMQVFGIGMGGKQLFETRLCQVEMALIVPERIVGIEADGGDGGLHVPTHTRRRRARKRNVS